MQRAPPRRSSLRPTADPSTRQPSLTTCSTSQLPSRLELGYDTTEDSCRGQRDLVGPACGVLDGVWEGGYDCAHLLNLDREKGSQPAAYL